MKFMEPVAWVTTDAENIMIKRAKPKMKLKEVEKGTDLLIRTHRLVVEHNLTSCVRSVYSRAAFQSSTNNGKVPKSMTNIISETRQLMISFPVRFSTDFGSRCDCDRRARPAQRD